MRDPARIDEMVLVLRDIWRREPDLRLGQLIFNAARMGDSTVEDVFNIEDGVLRKGLVRYLELINAKKKGSDEL